MGCALRDQHQTLSCGTLRGLCGLGGPGAPHSALLGVTLQVEVWLNRLLERMRSTLRSLIPVALGTYEDKPREQWVFDYPAQVGAAARGQAEPALRGTGGGAREPRQAQAPTLSHSRFLFMAVLSPWFAAGRSHLHPDRLDHRGWCRF